jgi:SAM-dependent methyltransferase
MSRSGIATMSNYEFCAQWTIEQITAASVRVLDYGCGAGETIDLLRARDIEAFGCDMFYEATDYLELEASDVFGTRILKMVDGKIPFPDDYFDFIVSNQVIEHVEDLELTLAEFQRVLKPGGQILNIFPDKSIWKEAHCDIPFLHWFPKGNNHFRVYYALLLRSLGMGSFKGDKSSFQWSQDTCEWIDKWTHYRNSNEIDRQYNRYFQEIRSIEADWIQQRLGSRRRWISWLPQSLQRALAIKLAGRVIVARNI